MLKHWDHSEWRLSVAGSWDSRTLGLRGSAGILFPSLNGTPRRTARPSEISE